ncbi:class F sortase [Blastococcus sp. TBT05-19]|nr:class F sortase [Blastococcus sp. TBT05-19]
MLGGRVVLAGVVGAVLVLGPAAPPPPSPAGPAADQGSSVVAEAGALRATPEPVRVRVPRIDVDSTLDRLGLLADGSLETPADFGQAGWYGGGPAPGDVGPAVLAGHVDSTAGPAVFWRLREVVAGDEVLVDRADGSTARFTVTRVARHPKDAFPTDEVYGPTPDAQLRLITCGGEFDSSRRSYEDNVVVFARSA